LATLSSQHRLRGPRDENPRVPICSIFRVAVAVQLLSLTSAPPAAGQSAGFVVRLGRDTIAVERFTRSADRIDGELLRRTPTTHLIRYSVTLQPGGLPSELSFTLERFGANQPRGAIRGGRVDFGRDSATIALERDTIQIRRLAARSGTPALPESYGLYELWLTRLMASGLDSLAVVFVAPLGGPSGSVQVRRAGADSVLLPVFGAPIRMRVDRTGRLLGLDGRATTIKYDVDRVESVDLTALARGFAAADASGRALGAWVSPRDTVTATLGRATLWIDYGRPSVRGREIFGRGVLGDTLWRTGANAATQFRTDVDLEIGGRRIPAGTYTLWTHYDSGKAELVINSQTGQWGTQYDRSRDVARVPLRVTAAEAPIELFTIVVRSLGAEGRRVLELRWDRTVLAVELRIPSPEPGSGSETPLR
jgi:hypothetical protein